MESNTTGNYESADVKDYVCSFIHESGKRCTSRIYPYASGAESSYQLRYDSIYCEEHLDQTSLSDRWNYSSGYLFGTIVFSLIIVGTLVGIWGDSTPEGKQMVLGLTIFVSGGFLLWIRSIVNKIIVPEKFSQEIISSWDYYEREVERKISEKTGHCEGKRDNGSTCRANISGYTMWFCPTCGKNTELDCMRRDGCVGGGDVRPNGHISLSRKNDYRITCEEHSDQHEEIMQSWRKGSSGTSALSDAIDLLSESRKTGLVDVVDTLTASWCPVCDSKMEGGSGKGTHYCANCQQRFDEYGVAY